MDIRGHVAKGFEPVRDAYAQNFRDGLEHGSAFAVWLGDELVVDLQGGWRDLAKTKPWQADTLSPMYSTGKPVMALVLAMLVDRGLLDYDAPVATWWPEFGVEGKRDFTLAQVFSHQCGLPGFLEPIDRELWFDQKGLAAEIAKLKPLFRPGEGTGYHPNTLGFIAAELALRTDGRSIGTILREDICDTLEIDYFIGTPLREHARIAEGMPPDGRTQLGSTNDTLRAAFLQPWSIIDRDRVEWKTRELPANNGIGTAASTARLVSAFAQKGRIGSRRLMSEQVCADAIRERVRGRDRIHPGEIAFSAGLQCNTQPMLFGPNPNCVGQTGWGGSAAFADPDNGFAAAYLMNRKGTALLADPRRERLVDALYACL